MYIITHLQKKMGVVDRDKVAQSACLPAQQSQESLLPSALLGRVIFDVGINGRCPSQLEFLQKLVVFVLQNVAQQSLTLS